MLKHVLFASAALALLAVPSMAAQTTIGGTVPLLCSALTDPAPITLTGLVDPTTGVAKAVSISSITSPLSGAWCNGTKNYIHLTLTKLVGNHTTTNPDFTNEIDYTMKQAGLDDIDTSHDPLTSSKEIATPFIIPAGTGSLATEAGTKKLVAGDYSATVTVTLEAGF